MLMRPLIFTKMRSCADDVSALGCSAFYPINKVVAFLVIKKYQLFINGYVDKILYLLIYETYVINQLIY